MENELKGRRSVRRRRLGDFGNGKCAFLEIAGEMFVREEHEARPCSDRDMDEGEVRALHVERVGNPFRIGSHIVDGGRAHHSLLWAVAWVLQAALTAFL